VRARGWPRRRPVRRREGSGVLWSTPTAAFGARALDAAAPCPSPRRCIRRGRSRGKRRRPHSISERATARRFVPCCFGFLAGVALRSAAAGHPRTAARHCRRTSPTPPRPVFGAATFPSFHHRHPQASPSPTAGLSPLAERLTSDTNREARLLKVTDPPLVHPYSHLVAGTQSTRTDLFRGLLAFPPPNHNSS
jgi:hypothetical protein